MSKALTALVQLGLSNEYQPAEALRDITACLQLCRRLIVDVVASQKNSFQALGIWEGDGDQRQKWTFEFLPVELRHRALELAGALIGERRGSGLPCLDHETADAEALKEALVNTIIGVMAFRDAPNQKMIEPRVHSQIMMHLKRKDKKMYLNERCRLIIDET